MKNFLHLKEVAAMLLFCCTFSVKADYTTDLPYVELTRAEIVDEESWYYWIIPAEGEKYVWIDWNNNNQYDEGEENIDDGFHEIESLTIRVYGKLQLFSFNENFITHIDVSNNPTIEKLYFSNNQVETIDVSMLTNLEEFCCNGNKLKNIDVSHNSKLKIFNCSTNELSTIDVSSNPELIEFDCYETNISTIDVSNNPNLEDLFCYNTELSTIDVSNNPNLKTLAITYTKISSIDVSNNLELKGIDISNTLIKDFDLSKNTKLTQLSCNNLGLTHIDISNNTNLYALTCTGNKLTSLDLSKHLELESLYAESNNLTSITLSPQQKYLYDVSIYENNLSEVAMESIVDNLYDWSSEYYGGYFTVINTESIYEKNVCNKLQVEKATAKKWDVFDYKNGANYGFNPYQGTEPSGICNLVENKTTVAMIEGNLHISVDPRIFGSTIQIYNMSGANILNHKLTKPETIIDMTDQAKGQYIVIINNKAFKVIR